MHSHPTSSKHPLMRCARILHLVGSSAKPPPVCLCRCKHMCRVLRHNCIKNTAAQCSVRLFPNQTRLDMELAGLQCPLYFSHCTCAAFPALLYASSVEIRARQEHTPIQPRQGYAGQRCLPCSLASTALRNRCGYQANRQARQAGHCSEALRCDGVQDQGSHHAFNLQTGGGCLLLFCTLQPSVVTGPGRDAPERLRQRHAPGRVHAASPGHLNSFFVPAVARLQA